MSAVAGLLSSSMAASEAVLDSKPDLVGEYQETILVRNARGQNAGTTLFGLMSRLKSESAENTEFNWFERDPVKREIYANGADAVIPPANATPGLIRFKANPVPNGPESGDAWPYLALGHVLRNVRTGEYVKVASANPGTNDVNVLRAIGGVPLVGCTIEDNDAWTIVTLGKDEGALPTRASYEEPEVLTNFVQTFNSVVELTNALKGNKLRSSAAGPLKSHRLQALEKISKDIEMAFLLGVKKRLVGTNGYEYYTGGIADAVDSAAPQNKLNGGGAGGVALQLVNDWLESFMTSGSDAKLALCGPKAFSAFSTFANSADNGFRIMNQETVFGMNITAINTPFGELDLTYHPLLKEIPSYGGWIFVADLAHLKQKTMEALFLEPNIQQNGQDAYKEQFRAKLGLKLGFAQAFGYARDLVKILPNA